MKKFIVGLAITIGTLAPIAIVTAQPAAANPIVCVHVPIYVGPFQIGPISNQPTGDPSQGTYLCVEHLV